MTKEIIDGVAVLIADNGAYITNEDTFSEKVYLGKYARENAWRDATAEEYEEWLNREPAPEQSAEASALTRYANELTGTNAETLQEATENLIKQLREE